MLTVLCLFDVFVVPNGPADVYHANEEALPRLLFIEVDVAQRRVPALVPRANELRVRREQHPRDLQVAHRVPAGVVEWRAVHVINGPHRRAMLEQHLHNVGVPVPRRHVQNGLPKAVASVRRPPLLLQELFHLAHIALTHGPGEAHVVALEVRPRRHVAPLVLGRHDRRRGVLSTAQETHGKIVKAHGPLPRLHAALLAAVVAHRGGVGDLGLMLRLLKEMIAGQLASALLPVA
mmetsp:Transcript_6637/g.18901  ORF Transcript_6637/g.18901 Transcript_6637/m.18901 type:complete len:234 (-) Transcript_6637:1492-2193(-)